MLYWYFPIAYHANDGNAIQQGRNLMRFYNELQKRYLKTFQLQEKRVFLSTQGFHQGLFLNEALCERMQSILQLSLACAHCLGCQLQTSSSITIHLPNNDCIENTDMLYRPGYANAQSQHPCHWLGFWIVSFVSLTLHLHIVAPETETFLVNIFTAIFLCFMTALLLYIRH